MKDIRSFLISTVLLGIIFTPDQSHLRLKLVMRSVTYVNLVRYAVWSWGKVLRRGHHKDFFTTTVFPHTECCFSHIPLWSLSSLLGGNCICEHAESVRVYLRGLEWLKKVDRQWFGRAQGSMQTWCKGERCSSGYAIVRSSFCKQYFERRTDKKQRCIDVDETPSQVFQCLDSVHFDWLHGTSSTDRVLPSQEAAYLQLQSL